ncbi:UNVERIFIED_ORG: hypothetical protein OKW15_001233 [Pseudomonas reinekei]|nr:hypothetical protein [Pseudomonas reinekei]
MVKKTVKFDNIGQQSARELSTLFNAAILGAIINFSIWPNVDICVWPFRFDPYAV